MNRPYINKFLGMVLEELERAEEKHPHFCDIYSLKEPQVVRKTLKHLREWNENGTFQADMILYEEVAEATEAWLQNDHEHCLKELAQCGAVIMRMMEHVQKEIDNGTHPESHEKKV